MGTASAANSFQGTGPSSAPANNPPFFLRQTHAPPAHAAASPSPQNCAARVNRRKNANSAGAHIM